MTYMSPLLQNRLNSIPSTQGNNNYNNRHEKIYENLTKTANSVKPNEAKAQMVKEGILGNPLTAIKDTFKDAKNFFKAVKSGEMGDNNLGKINDLGLKAGALLIASFLATHAKTKTQAIMQFIGGATFVSAMSLWPKLFINLPARLVHGFRIDRKYISAQGDKKDFGLDNQFIVWDAYPEEQLRKDAKNANIDYDSKNGKEKIQRKIQKTTLQNRTLWMATAGFATPLISAMVGNVVEPKVQKAVIKHEFNKTKSIVDNGIPNHISQLKPDVQNVENLDNLFKDFQGKPLDDNFYEKLAKMLNPVDFADQIKDNDDMKPYKNLGQNKVIETLKEIQKSDDFLTVDKENLEELLKGAKKQKLGSNNFTDEDIKGIISELKGDFSIGNVQKTLKAQKVAEKSITEIISNVKTDNSSFFEFIKQYNEGPLANMRARTKGYLNLINPIVGSKSESVFTGEINSTINNLLKRFGYNHKTLLDIRKKENNYTSNLLSETLQEKLKDVKFGDDNYKQIIQELTTEGLNEDVTEIIEKLKDDSNLKSIMPEIDTTDESMKKLNQAILGSKDEKQGIKNTIQQFINNKQIDLDTIKSRAVMCANFEARLQSGDLKGVLNDEEIQIARKLLYDATISDFKNNGYVINKDIYNKVVEKVFNKESFTTEAEIIPNIQETISNAFKIAKNNFKGTSTEGYLKCSSFTELIKNAATSLGNNKSWMKIFGSMSVALAAITLLVQPLFGNIKDEFPDEKENGGAK